MKKLLFFISALAGLFFAASCEREEMAPASENAVVTYSVEVPEIATRAIGDDVSNINDLVYAVYCTEADNLEDAQNNGGLQLLYQKNYTSNPFVDGKATISIELVNNKNYLILFWAQNQDKWVGTPFDLTAPIVCNPTLTANDENLAAFSGVDFLKSDNLAVKRELKLKRAVAQINVATTLADNFTITPTQSTVVVKNAGAEFNVVKQIAEGNADITFETANVPAGNLTVNSTGYKYAAMNYIFANGNVEVDYEISYTTGTGVAGTVKNTVPGVPVAQNYRTNIIGSLLTSQADYDVVLDDFSENGNTGNVEVVTEGIVKNQNGDYEISSANGMAYAMNNLWAQGGTYYVVKSVDMLPYIDNITIPSIPAGTTLNVYTAIPVVTRSTDVITISGLPYLINVIESGANVSLQGVAMTGDDNQAVVNVVEEGANVVLSDCSVNTSEDFADLVTTGADYVVDAAEVNDEYSIKAALATGINEFTITDNIESDEIMEITKSVVINGNNKTLTSTARRAFNVMASEIEIIINDLNIDVATERVGTNDVRGISIFTDLHNIALTLNNCTVDFTHDSANDWAYAVNVSGNGTSHNVTVNGGRFEGANVVNVHGANNVITIKNAELNCTYSNNDMYYGACIWVLQKQNSSVYAEGNTFNGDNAIAFNLGTGTALEEKDNIDNTKGLSVNGDRYTIYSINGLKWLCEQVNGGNDFKGKTVVLGNDINLNNEQWTSIGTEAKPFKGTFDGKDKTIKNLNVVVTEGKEGKAHIGFFGYAKDATIQNVVFENVNLNIACLDIDHSQGHIGTVAGTLEGTSIIENVTVKGDIFVEATPSANGASRVAVVVGGNSYANVTMKNVHVNANEGSYLKANNNVGALAGQLQNIAVFENCSSNINVTGTKFFAGGIIGLTANKSTFTNCHTTGDVTITAGREGRANDHYRVGGIAGGWADGKTNVCTLTNCTYEGTISGTNADGSVANPLDYAGYVGRGYTLSNCAGSKVIIDGVEYVQASDKDYGIYIVDGVYEIATLPTLQWFANEVNSGNNYFAGATIKLTNDIDLNNVEWTPIGSAYKDHGFMGNFDGNGKTIKNLKISNITLDSDGYAYAGLFGVTEGTATERNYVKNLTIENVNISTEGHIVSAAIAYPYYTTVEDITVKGNIEISGGDYTAGVLAYTRRCVDAKNLSVIGNEESAISGAITVGGVISDIQMNGGLKANYSNFSASGLTISADKNVGGISGIICLQTLDGATVNNVNIVSDDARKGTVAGALGDKAIIKNVSVTNVTGASDVVGAAYDNPSEYVIVELNGEYIALSSNKVCEIGNNYIIPNADGLLWFADQVNVQKNNFSGKTVILAANIDLAGISWIPVGQTGATQFLGTFDGQGKTISNLSIDATAQTGAHYSSGLFGWLNKAVVKNVNVNGATVKGNHNVGVIAGYMETTGCTIENCHVYGAAIECHVANDDANGDKCGVIVGHAGNAGVAVSNCTASNSTVSAGRDAGQIAGAAKAANVTGCSASNVTVTANGEGSGANIKNEIIGRLL